MVSIAQVLVWAVLYYFVFEMLTVREIIRTSTFEIFKRKARRLFIVKVCVIASVLVSGLLLGVILSEMDAFPNAFILSSWGIFLQVLNFPYCPYSFGKSVLQMSA